MVIAYHRDGWDMEIDNASNSHKTAYGDPLFRSGVGGFGAFSSMDHHAMPIFEFVRFIHEARL